MAIVILAPVSYYPALGSVLSVYLAPALTISLCFSLSSCLILCFSPSLTRCIVGGQISGMCLLTTVECVIPCVHAISGALVLCNINRAGILWVTFFHCLHPQGRWLVAGAIAQLWAHRVHSKQLRGSFRLHSGWRVSTMKHRLCSKIFLGLYTWWEYRMKKNACKAAVW